MHTAAENAHALRLQEGCWDANTLALKAVHDCMIGCVAEVPLIVAAATLLLLLQSLIQPGPVYRWCLLSSHTQLCIMTKTSAVLCIALVSSQHVYARRGDVLSRARSTSVRDVFSNLS
jgi:hypothetical protein